MRVAIRYFSRGGHVRAMAEAISRGTGIEAIAIDEPGAEISEPVDLLFIGGALYSFQLDNRLKDFIDSIPEGLVEEAICFGSSMLTRRPVYLIQERLRNKGIKISKQAIYARNRPNENLIEVIEYFAKNEMTRDRSLDGMAPYMIFKKTEEARERREAEQAAIEAGELDKETVEAQRAAEKAEEAMRKAEAAARDAERVAQEAREAAAVAEAQAAAKKAEADEALRLAREAAEKAGLDSGEAVTGAEDDAPAEAEAAETTDMPADAVADE